MNKTLVMLALFSVASVLSCQQETPTQKDSTAANAISDKESLSDQAYLTQLVKENEIVDKERSLVHLSHVCNLKIGNQTYAVIDTRELVQGATNARGVNQIILLNAENQLINRIEYGNARPLFCENNKLYLYGDVIPDGQAEEGNVLVFTDSGFAITAVKEDLNKKLPLNQN